MTSKNDITGDNIQTKVPSNQYRDNFDLIFRLKKEARCETCDGAGVVLKQYSDDTLAYGACPHCSH